MRYLPGSFALVISAIFYAILFAENKLNWQLGFLDESVFGFFTLLAYLGALQILAAGLQAKPSRFSQWSDDLLEKFHIPQEIAAIALFIIF
jgi:hypothetical protein